MTGLPGFHVDPDHLGPDEAAWAASPVPRLPALTVPNRRRAIVLAPHPDDEVLGAGGLVQVLVAGGVEIEVWAVTDGEACFGPLGTAASQQLRDEREAESREALRRLGLPAGVRRYRLDEPDGGVATRRVAEYLTDQLDAGWLCVAPWSGDGHPDHDAVGAAAEIACAVTGATLVQYLVWAWHWADPRGRSLPWAACRRLDLTRRQAATKRWATGAFRSQLHRPVNANGGLAVLPAPVLRRFWRRWEVYVDPLDAGAARLT